MVKRLVEILVVAGLCGLTGRLGILLAIPPGYASPLFPPSGLALAVTLMLGPRIWPGVFLGSFLMNVSVSRSAAAHLPISSILLIAAGIGAGAALQARLGASLIRRYVSFPNSLSDERDVVKLFGLGMLSCVTSATVGLLTLWIAGLVVGENVFFSWCTWATGDALGVIVFTPLTLIWCTRRREMWNVRRYQVTIPLLIATGLTTAFYVQGEMNWGNWLLMVCGLLFSGLLGAFLLVVTGRRLLIQKTVDEKTAELNQNKAELELKVRERTHELELSNKRLAASNAELEQFAYIASHDLQEPLRMVVNYLQFLEKRNRDRLGEEDKMFIGYAVSGAMRMQALVRDLLTFAQVGRGEMATAAVDFNRSVAVAQENLRELITESGATIDAAALPTLTADARQVSQLFQNLIANAIKYRSEAPPVIRIAVEAREGEWLFSVRDNGIGIKPEYSKKIFVVFQRLHSDRTKYPGTGIGLSICKKIVEGHQGRIWVESVPNAGATFYFTLPRTTDQLT